MIFFEEALKLMLDSAKTLGAENCNYKKSVGRVLAKNILSSEECTKCNPDKYFSYRRSGEKAGRMISVIGLT